MRLHTILLSLLTLGLLAPLALAQKGVAPIDLGTLGGSFSQANGINGHDTTVGAATIAGDTFTHAFWTNGLGVPQDMGTLIGPNGNSSAASVTLIANGSQFTTSITGTSDANVTDPNSGLVYTATHSFYFTPPSTMTDIGTLGGDTTQANYGRNGYVVGWSYIPGDVAMNAFIWNPTTNVMQALGPLAGGTNSQALGVVPHGTEVVGSSDMADGTTHAVLWAPTANKIFDLGTLGGSFAQATAVSAFGLVAGYSTLAGDTQTDAFVGTYGDLFDIGNLGGSYAQPNAISDNGVVVGSSNITGDADVHAFKWTVSGGMVDLNNLLPLGSPWDLQSANAIGPDGTIVGVGIINGEFHAFAW